MVGKEVLPNGLRVILAPMEQVKSVTVLVLVEAGSRYENKKDNGISHFLEHMMFKGTTKRPSKMHIATLLDSIGGVFNAFTSKEYTGFYVKAAAEHQELIMDILSDITLHSLYQEEEVERERGVIIEEINGDEDDPLGRSFQILEKIMFTPSPLSFRVAGEKENIAGISREEIAAYAGRMYHGNSMVLTIAGALAPESLSMADRYFGKVTGGKENQFAAFRGEQKEPRVLVYFKQTDQAHFCLGLPGLSLDDPDRYAASVLSTILGETMSSRLFMEVREKRGLAYAVGSGSEEYRDTGVLLTYASVKLEKTEEAILVILEQLRELRENMVGDEELQRAKDNASGKMILALEDSFKVARFNGAQELLERTLETPEEILAKIKAVTREDIKSTAKRIITDQKLNLALVGPFKDEEKFAKLLRV